MSTDTSLLQQIVERQRALLKECMKREYNPFEPNNQSEFYKRLQRELADPFQPLATRNLGKFTDI